MSSSACLRIVLDLSEEKIARLDAMGPLVTRAAENLLIERWAVPRRYVVLTTYSYLLTDPAADSIDVAVLKNLATALKAKLFGESACGDVTLLLYEGDESETARFAAMQHSELKRLIETGQCGVALGGSLRSMSSRATEGASADANMKWEPIQFGAVGGAAGRSGTWSAVYSGVYFTPTQRFVGSGVIAVNSEAPIQNSIFEGEYALPKDDDAVAFDMASLEAAVHLMVTDDRPGLALQLPVCFGSVTRSATRQDYVAAFKMLPAGKRNLFSAVLYATPRVPSERAFAELKPMLGEAFSKIDLQIDDPDFNFDQIPKGVVQTVTLRLPDGDSFLRNRAMKRFLDRRAEFRRCDIRPGLTNVRSSGEFKSGWDKGACYVSGSAICPSTAKPIRASVYDSSMLPLQQRAA